MVTSQFDGALHDIIRRIRRFIHARFHPDIREMILPMQHFAENFRQRQWWLVRIDSCLVPTGEGFMFHNLRADVVFAFRMMAASLYLRLKAVYCLSGIQIIRMKR